MRAIIVMGVSGSGKSTVASRLAKRINATYIDADDHHPEANITKMRSGAPLTDADRAGWLKTLNALLRASPQRRVVLACSALRQTYRDALSHDLPERPHFVYLKGEADLLAKRMAGRAGHFMPADLLRSQLDTLEEPADAIIVPITLTPDEQVECVMEALDQPS